MRTESFPLLRNVRWRPRRQDIHSLRVQWGTYLGACRGRVDMETQYRPRGPFRVNGSAVPANQSSPKIDDACALAGAIVELVREPLVVLDEELRVVIANRAFCQMFKVTRPEVQGRPLHALDGARWGIPRRKFLSTNGQAIELCEVDADIPGIGRRTVLLNARKPSHERNGRGLVLLAIQDTSERRVGDRQTVELLQQKAALLQEMQHRTANSLQVVASILLLKARAEQSEEARLYLKDTHQRIMSMTAVQRRFGIAGHGEQIEVATLLECRTARPARQVWHPAPASSRRAPGSLTDAWRGQ